MIAAPAFALLLAGCPGDAEIDAAPAGRAAGSPASFTLAYLGAVDGEIEPCG